MVIHGPLRGRSTYALPPPRSPKNTAYTVSTPIYYSYPLQDLTPYFIAPDFCLNEHGEFPRKERQYGAAAVRAIQGHVFDRGRNTVLVIVLGEQLGWEEGLENDRNQVSAINLEEGLMEFRISSTTYIS